MNSLNYKIKTLIAVFLGYPLLLANASVCQETFSPEREREREERVESTDRKLSLIEQYVLNKYYQYILSLKYNDVKKFSLSEFESALRLVQENQEKEGKTPPSVAVESKILYFIDRKTYPRVLGVRSIKEAATGVGIGLAIVTTWGVTFDMMDEYLSPLFDVTPDDKHLVRFISEPIIDGIDWTAELFKSEQTEE